MTLRLAFRSHGPLPGPRGGGGSAWPPRHGNGAEAGKGAVRASARPGWGCGGEGTVPRQQHLEASPPHICHAGMFGGTGRWQTGGGGTAGVWEVEGGVGQHTAHHTPLRDSPGQGHAPDWGIPHRLCEEERCCIWTVRQAVAVSLDRSGGAVTIQGCMAVPQNPAPHSNHSPDCLLGQADYPHDP